MPNISLSKISLGGGLFILSVSCLIATVLCAEYANSISPLKKIEMKLQFNSQSTIYVITILISVVGCITALTAIANIVLLIIKEDQKLILTILGSVSSGFALFCIICEGLYLNYTIKFAFYNTIIPQIEKFYDIDLGEYNHENAQTYIKNSIEALYEQGVKNLLSKEENKDVEIPSWATVSKQLGKSIYKNPPEEEDTIFTYRHLWNEKYPWGHYYDDLSLQNPVTFTHSDGIIYADCYDCSEKVPVASFRFQYNISYTPKNLVCWPDNVKKPSKLHCKSLKVRKFRYNATVDSMTLKENIVIGNYISEKVADDNKMNVNYQVNKFPAAFHILAPSQANESDFLVFADSTSHFGASGKQLARASAQEYINRIRNTSSINPKVVRVYAPSKPKNWGHLVEICQNYWDRSDADPNEEIEHACYSDGDGRIDNEYNDELENVTVFEHAGVDVDDLLGLISENFKEENMGKMAPAVKSYMEGYTRSILENFPKFDTAPNGLYSVMLANLVVQIVGILLWICGNFVGPVFEKDDNVNSASLSSAALINNQ